MKTLMKTILSRRLLLVLSILAAGFLSFVMYQLQILPIKYYIPFVGVLFLIVFLLYVAQGDRDDVHPIRVAIFKLVNVVVAIALVFVSWNVMKGSDFLSTITGGGDQIIEMNVAVLKSSSYQSLSDLKGCSFGANTSVDSVNVNKAEAVIEDEIDNIEVTPYQSYSALVDALKNGSVQAIIIQSIELESDSIEAGFKDQVRIIKTIEIKIPGVSANSAKVTKEPFIVFISGRDKQGPISTFSLSDVNMIAVINPTTKQVLLVSIPRDYFVEMIGIDGVVGKDKLTHSAKGGTEATIKTVENFMNIQVNYYAKFNFTSFMNVIDALGGITVNVPKYDVIGRDDGVFVTRLDHYTIEPGEQTFDSKHALSFVRERYAFVLGDEIRGKNQMIMLKAIIKKCCSPAIITKLDGVFESLSNSFETNLSAKEIKSLINMQIDDMASWDVQSYRLTGDASGRTMTLATVGDVSSVNPKGIYITIPNEEKIAQAKEYIDAVMNNEIIKVTEE